MKFWLVGNHLKQNLNEFKIQLARKIRTDVLSLYRKMGSLGAPVFSIVNAKRNRIKLLANVETRKDIQLVFFTSISEYSYLIFQLRNP